jgi:hypothetical protein
MVPRWVRARTLAVFSDELAGYFPTNMTAGEIIEKERRNT